MTLEEQLAAALEENRRLQAQLNKPKGYHAPELSFKVSEKGAMSCYGLGRFPVTLYKEQWKKLLAQEKVEEARQFLTDHDPELATKAKIAANGKSESNAD